MRGKLFSSSIDWSWGTVTSQYDPPATCTRWPTDCARPDAGRRTIAKNGSSRDNVERVLMVSPSIRMMASANVSSADAAATFVSLGDRWQPRGVSTRPRGSHDEIGRASGRERDD